MLYAFPFVIALVMTPIVRKIALISGFIDKVNGDLLKIHKEPVPLLGGVVIVIAMAVGIVTISYQLSAISEIRKIIAIAAAGIAVFGVGLWDDLKGVRPVIRLLVQVLAGVVVLWAGMKVNFIPIRWIEITLTLFFIVGAINAFNVTDGMDGLCVGIALVACIGFFLLGLVSANIFLALLSAILFMSLLGFLPYNFHPARIFLGDAGSGFLGFMMGVMAIMAASRPYSIISFAVSILVICMPVLDMAFAILRRAIRGGSLFIGDREHIYDILLRKGFSQPRTWLAMCGMQMFLVLVAFMFAYSI